MEAVSQSVCFAKVSAGLCTRNKRESRAEGRVCVQGLKGRSVYMQSLQERKVGLEDSQERWVYMQGFQHMRACVHGAPQGSVCMQGLLERRLCMQGLQQRRFCMLGLQGRKLCTQSLRQRGCGRSLKICMGMHPEWRQVDNKIRRLEHRIADFRIMSNDLRIQHTKIGSDDPEINQMKLMEHIEKREKEVVAEREALQKEMEHLTVFFHKGAEPEYKGLRRFFLSYLYHTSRKAFENFPVDEFDRVLAESPGGISFELSERGSVIFAHHLCKKLLIGKKISISATGLDTSPLAIALAVLQAGAQKHCDDPSCRREECHILKEDYEQLFEAFFKRKIRPLINQKSRGEMSIQYDATLKIERVSGVKVS